MNAAHLAARVALVATLVAGAALAPESANAEATTPSTIPAAAAAGTLGGYAPRKAANRYERHKRDACRRYVARFRPAYAPRGWRITCEAGFVSAGLYGYADTGTRIIRVNGLMSDRMIRAVVAHEWGHAEQHSWSRSKRATFERAVGRSLYTSSRDWWAYVNQPAELWAQGRAVCSGHVNFDHRPYYTCKTLSDWARY